MYSGNSIWPKTDHCGTPQDMSAEEGVADFLVC